MSKTCTLCKKDKPLTDFHKKSSGKFGVRSECKSCRAAPPKEWANGAGRTCTSCGINKSREKFPLSENGNPRRCCKLCRYRFENYGLSLIELNELLDLQNGCCAICDSELIEYAVDHDHTCCPGKKTCGKCVRGLLCVQCNTRLGWFEKYGQQAKLYLGVVVNERE